MPRGSTDQWEACRIRKAYFAALSPAVNTEQKSVSEAGRFLGLFNTSYLAETGQTLLETHAFLKNKET